MKINALATTSHYREHVEAVWKHLPDALRGEARWGKGVNDHGWPSDDVVMVGGFANIDLVPSHRVIYVEHGAGQSYRDIKESHASYYHGAQHPERVIAYLSPRQRVADTWGRPAYAAGAPACDPHPLETGNTIPVVAITFHWDAAKICPEAGSAFEHYGDALGALAERLYEQGFEVWGHHHPRDTFLPQVWNRIGVKLESDVNNVRAGADLLIADNTSLMYEMCYLNRTVIALNAPWYRRNINHGLRFWDWHGMEIDSPEHLLAFPFASYLSDDFHHALWRDVSKRRDAVDAYGRELNDGRDGFRAAAWLTSLATLL